jgi:hypothetical protein
VSGVETILEMNVRVGPSEKVKGTSERFPVNQSIIDRASVTEEKDILRWEGG